MHERHGFDPSVPILGTLASCEIVIDRPKSHNHLADEMDSQVARQVLELTLHQVDAQDQDYLIKEIPSDEPSLLTPRISTNEDDAIVYAYRHGRAGQTRFVLNREPEPTNHVTLILKRDKNHPGVMVLITALAGPIPEPEPWDPHLTDEASKAASKLFWAKHALIWQPRAVDFTRPFGKTPEAVDSAELLKR